LAGITAEDVGPEIAAELDIQSSSVSLDGWPEPLPTALPDVMPFDLELMPESFRPLVKDVAERMQVPLDFPAVAAIATIAGVTTRRAVIQLEVCQETSLPQDKFVLIPKDIVSTDERRSLALI